MVIKLLYYQFFLGLNLSFGLANSGVLCVFQIILFHNIKSAYFNISSNGL